jgi:hypothetical protein
MTQKELQLAGKLLDMAADQFGGHNCNDLPDEIWEGWTDEERSQLNKEYHEMNGDPEEYEPGHIHMEDFTLMALLSHKLQNKPGIVVSNGITSTE